MIKLLIGIITGLTLLFTYLLGDKRRIRKLKDQEAKLVKELRIALKNNDTVAMSRIELELKRLRHKLGYTRRKRDATNN